MSLARSGQGDGGAGFEGFHHEGAFDGGDVVEGTEHVKYEVAVVGHVGGHDFEHIVESARYVVALGHFVDGADAVNESLGFFATQFADFYVAENYETPSEFVGVEQSHISPDVTFLLEPADALVDGCRRPGHFSGKFFGGQAAILLKQTQDADVGLVEMLDR